MTTVTSLGIAGIIALASFGLFSFSGHGEPAQNTKKKEIRGEETGTIVELDAFDKIELTGSCDVELVKGTTNSIELFNVETTADNDQFNVEKGKLTINAISGKTNKISAKVTVAGSLKELSISGSGDLNLADAFDGLEKITIMGSGDVLSAKENVAKKLRLTIMGSGDIDFLNTSCEEVHCSILGSGDIKVGASKSIHAEITGSGNIYYKGEPNGKSESINIGSGKIISL